MKYIPGDLVKSNNNPNIIWKVKDVSQNKRNNILYRLISIEGNKVFIYFEHQITPIQLTPDILRANGWKTQNKKYYFLTINKGFVANIGIDFEHKSSNGNLYVEINGSNMAEIQYCHQLQHLLFGLGLPFDLKV